MPDSDEPGVNTEKMTFSSRYNLESKLGAGGMGAVYKAYDKVLDKLVAVKVLLPNSNTDAIIRFHQEARMAARLHHANILTVLDFGQNEDGDLFLVMDFLDGESLHDLLKKRGGHLPLVEAVPIFLQICTGLEHAHSQGILHRDIKPSNIMLVKDERNQLQVKIVDFGLAKVEGSEQSLTTTGMRVGSPLYMSPEQAQTENVDHRSDIYSLGCLMYKTLTGKVPLYGDTFLVTLDMHINVIPLSINDVDERLEFPHELANIVAKTLEKDPDARYQSASEVAESLLSLDLTFLNLAPQPIPLFETQIDLPQVKPIEKSLFGSPKYLRIGAALLALAGIGVAVLASKKMSEMPEVTAKPSIVIPMDMEPADLLADKIYLMPGGLLSTNADFTDDDMPEFKRFLPFQEKVSFFGSKVTGKSFDYLRKMKKLVQLNLSDTKIDDAALEKVSKLKKLKQLSISRNKVGDAGIEHLAKLKNLSVLEAQKTLITDKGLEYLAQNSGISALDISGCKGITGAGLDMLASMPSLSTLVIVDCPNITKADIARFKNETNTCSLVHEGKLIDPDLPEGENEKWDLKHQRSRQAQQNLIDHRALQTFLKYEEDMKNPYFYRFFQSKDCWKPRKSYDDIKSQRVIDCLKDKEMQELMKDPRLREQWQSKEVWASLHGFADRINSFITPEALRP